MENLPTTYRAWRRSTGNVPLTIELAVERMPQQLGPEDVLVRIRTVSLNYRDVAILQGKYVLPAEERGIPASDCAAEVISVGSHVQNLKQGDRVSAVFDANNLDGSDKGDMAALGGELSGVLREYAVFDQKCLVKVPEYLSWEESSTLACAGVTAWTSLKLPQSSNRGNVALLQGTGGVSMFALILCLSAGIHPIITSSSDTKLERIKKLASPQSISTVNYKTQNVAQEVLKLTDGKGVDLVVNTIGAASLSHDLEVLRRRGTVSLVGFLSETPQNLDSRIFPNILLKNATVKGICVGSVIDFRNLNAFLDEMQPDLSPLLDRVFQFVESKEAFNYLHSGKHVGKIVIQL